MSAFETLSDYIINSVDQTKLSRYTPPTMQHHSFFWNLPPSSIFLQFFFQY